MTTAAIQAARDWAAEHRREQPDDRMMQVCLAVALHELAEDIDRGGDAMVWSATVSALIRDRADAIEPDPRPAFPGATP